MKQICPNIWNIIWLVSTLSVWVFFSNWFHQCISISFIWDWTIYLTSTIAKCKLIHALVISYPLPGVYNTCMTYLMRNKKWLLNGECHLFWASDLSIKVKKCESCRIEFKTINSLHDTLNHLTLKLFKKSIAGKIQNISLYQFYLWTLIIFTENIKFFTHQVSQQKGKYSCRKNYRESTNKDNQFQ